MTESLTRLFNLIEQGDDVALQAFWEACYPKLVRLARQKLGSLPRRIRDEEDLAASGLHSFFRAAEAGRFTNVQGSADLWKILAAVTHRKIIDYQRHLAARQPDGGQVVGESVFGLAADGGDGLAGWAIVAGNAPTPDLEACIEEQTEFLIGLLDEALYRPVALLRLEGYSQPEIAERLSLSLATIERRLRDIRAIWTRALQATSPARDA